MTHNQDSTATLELLSAAQCWNSNDIKSRKYIDDAANLLNEQWPRGGSVVDYKCKLLGNFRSDIEMVDDSMENITINVESLPCSYLLIDSRKGQLVGHGRLTECFEGPGGNAAAATYILTQPRQMGYGRVLMTLLEHQAVKLGYHYIYLWTTTAILFYQKLKYSRTERVSLNSACLKTLQTQQVGALEAMLTKRAQKSSYSSTTGRSTKETVTLPPDAVTDNDIWLRKRLVESVQSTAIPFENRMDELRVALHQYPSTITCWKYYFNHIPWQQQIGPSCGLAALRMLREHYSNDASVDIPSLLTEAQTKGYSFDGEIFNVDNIIKLADYCGLNTCLKSFQTMSIVDIWNILKVGGTLIIPYDSQPFTRNPCTTGGKNAHYGIVVGMMLGSHHDHDRRTAVVFGVEKDENIVVPKTPQIHPMTNIDIIQEDATHIILLVQHGLSSKWTIALMEDFITSNGQLCTIDTTKCCYLPEHTTMNLSDSIIVCYGQKIE